VKTILLFLASITLGFAQDPELFINDWYLEKIVIDNVDYPTPTAYNHTLNFGEPSNGLVSMGCSYCLNYYFFMSIVDENTIQNEGGVIPINENCDFTEYELFVTGHITTFFDQINSTYLINYEINEIGNHKQLVLSKSENVTLYYNNVNLSQEDFLFENTVSLYPNPVQDILNVKNSTSNLVNVKIYDLNGRLLHNHALQINEVTLDMSQLTSGVYVVVLENEMGHQISRKIVKTGK
jgi:hypothetical protein